jgi:hypothetical protein
MENIQSQQTNELFTALAKAQDEMEIASKDSSNPFYKSKYADLQSVVGSSRPYLAKHGLSVIHLLQQEEQSTYMVTQLSHSSGQYIRSKVKLSPQKPDVQSLGSYITYMKRYCYAAIVGVVTGDDDDGEGCMDRINANGKNKILPEECILSPEQVGTIRNLIGSRPEIADRITKKYGVNTLLQIKQKHFDDIIKGLEAINKTQTHTNGASHAK